MTEVAALRTTRNSSSLVASNYIAEKEDER